MAHKVNFCELLEFLSCAIFAPYFAEMITSRKPEISDLKNT